MQHHYSAADQLHIMLSLVIVAGYLVVPFTALRKIPLPRITKITGMLFFLTCATTHVGMATGVADSPWFILNDAVQAISVVVFIYTLNTMVSNFFGVGPQRKADTSRVTAQSD